MSTDTRYVHLNLRKKKSICKIQGTIIVMNNEKTAHRALPWGQMERDMQCIHVYGLLSDTTDESTLRQENTSRQMSDLLSTFLLLLMRGVFCRRRFSVSY